MERSTAAAVHQSHTPCVHCAAALQVTASQLSLLEATMARMERVAVWSLMSGGGGGRDVFNVSCSCCLLFANTQLCSSFALLQPATAWRQREQCLWCGICVA
jgi:hypothetical protein